MTDTKKKGGWWITCECGYCAHIDDFSPSLADECICPKCGMCFEVDLTWASDDDDEPEED
jgi:hypothetical protein